jgi:hypothetical protein
MKDKFTPLEIPYIYVILDEQDNTVKIGFSVNPRKRLSHLQIGNGRRLQLIQTFVGDAVTESDIHSEIYHYNVSGEWFTYNDYVKSVLQRYKENSFDHKNPKFLNGAAGHKDPIYAYQNYLLDREISQMRFDRAVAAEAMHKCIFDFVKLFEHVVEKGKQGDTEFFQSNEPMKSLNNIAGELEIVLRKIT